MDMFLKDEQMRQEIIRGIESEDDIEGAAKLYEQGWAIPDIAESIGVPIRTIIRDLRGYISVNPEDIAHAEKLAELEESADKYMTRRIK
jgi:hypothetical protein